MRAPPVERRGELGGVRLGAHVAVRVPASSANLGPGFDSMALALGLHDLVTVQALPAGDSGHSLQVAVTGEGAGSLPRGEEHLVVRALRAGLAHAGVRQPNLCLTCRNGIPHGRGLGSSAAAVVAGLVAARGLLDDPSALDDATVFALATDWEGHPDNAAAALFGGFVVSWLGQSAPSGLPAARHVRLDVDPRVRLVVCVPEGRLATSSARAMLPAHVPHADAAFTAARAALLVEALTRRPDLLGEATQDRLHQTQRAPAMPETEALVSALRAAGAPAVVSGAGPSVLVMAPSKEQAADVHACVLSGVERWGRWLVLTPVVDMAGAQLVPVPRRP